MLKYSKIKENKQQLLALSSLTIEEFEELLQVFGSIWMQQMKYYTIEGKYRERAYREKSNGVLPLVADKLFFILYYLKNNPLQESLAASFGMTQPQANKYIHIYKKVLHEALSVFNCLPERKVSKLKDRLLASGEDEFYCDGTERLIPRSTDWETQKENYSGKKHAHSKKNNVVTNTKCEIEYLSQTYEGSVHDKKITDEEELEFPDDSTVFVDTGFKGLTVKGEGIEIIMPAKRQKGEELTVEQKHNNKLISKVRIKVEHAIGGGKRLRIVKDKVRAWKDEFRDFVMEIACAIHNFRLKFRPWVYPDSEKILQT